MSSEKAVTEKKDGFNSSLGFILACVGSSVGMGNIWRFPVLVSAWGGMTFLIPYFIFVILIGSTGIIGEIALGRSTGSGPIGAFGAATEHAGKGKKLGGIIGAIPVLGSMALGIGYSCVVGWIIKYCYLAINGSLSAMGNNMEQIGGMFDATAKTMGNNMWLIIALVISFAIMALGIAGGIEKANKIMMPLLFVMLIGLAIYIGFQPGASGGYKYILTVKPQGLADPKLWIYAFGQAFFSLSVAGNGTVIYGSYLDKDADVPNASKNIAIFDTIAALLAAFVIIPAMATSGVQLDKGGPGLMFIYLLNVMNSMPGGRVFAIIFYICVLFAGLTSLVNLFETPVATLQQQFGMKRVPAVVTIGVIGGAIAIFIQGIVSGWMDFVSIYICPLGAFLAGVMFFWVFGKKYVFDSVNQGAKHPKGDTWYVLCKFLYCGLAIASLILGAVLGGIG